MQERFKLARVQMTPDPRLGMIPASQLAATCGAGPPDTCAELQVNVHPTFRRVQVNCLDKPGFDQAENRRIQVRVLRALPPERTLSGQLPRKTLKDQ